MRIVVSTALLAAMGALPAAAQAPEADIFLVSLARSGGRLTVTGARNLTNRPGYDNQPSWSSDGRSLFFTSVREGEQADIYRIEPGSDVTKRVTTTAPESEYSATPMPRRNAISVIRVEGDSTQRLWSVPLDGSASKVILDGIKPVGYHTWANDTTLALFVLGNPNSLQLARTTTGKGDTIATGIGRSLHTTRDGLVSYVYKQGDGEWWLMQIEPNTRQQRRLVRMPSRVEDYAWTSDGLVLAAEGSVLKAWDMKRGGDWFTVADLGQYGLGGVTRLAVSPRGDAIAVVAQPAEHARENR